MRTIDSTCLLCEFQKADKENSHIFPKFITKSFFGKGKGYEIDVQKADQPPTIKQDTPKENYILCNKCEKFFELLETYIAEMLHKRINDVRKISEFKFVHSAKGQDYKICNKIDPMIMNLFVLSIAFRVHISSHKMFKDFTLTADNLLEVKSLLMSYHSSTKSNLLENLAKTPYISSNLIFAFLTSENTGDDTENFMTGLPGFRSPYFFIMNKYLLIFSFNNNSGQLKYEEWNNFGNNPIKIGFISHSDWLYLKNNIFKIYSTISSNILKQKGKAPYQGTLK